MRASTPPGTINKVCSNWADLLPSCVVAVHLSCCCFLGGDNGVSCMHTYTDRDTYIPGKFPEVVIIQTNNDETTYISISVKNPYARPFRLFFSGNYIYDTQPIL